MRKLSNTETEVLQKLAEHGSYCPGKDSGGLVLSAVRQALDALAKRKLVLVEDTDDGPRYSLSDLGIAEAGK